MNCFNALRNFYFSNMFAIIKCTVTNMLNIHIDFNGSGREPMFGAALESDSTTSVPEMSVAMKGLLKDMVEAMDEFDKALRIK